MAHGAPGGRGDLIWDFPRPDPPGWEGSEAPLRLPSVGEETLLATTVGWKQAKDIRVGDVLLGGRTVGHPTPWAGEVTRVVVAPRWSVAARRLGTRPLALLHDNNGWRHVEAAAWGQGPGPGYTQGGWHQQIDITLNGVMGGTHGGVRTLEGWELGGTLVTHQGGTRRVEMTQLADPGGAGGG